MAKPHKIPTTDYSPPQSLPPLYIRGTVIPRNPVNVDAAPLPPLYTNGLIHPRRPASTFSAILSQSPTDGPTHTRKPDSKSSAALPPLYTNGLINPRKPASTRPTDLPPLFSNGPFSAKKSSTAPGGDSNPVYNENPHYQSSEFYSNQHSRSDLAATEAPLTNPYRSTDPYNVRDNQDLEHGTQPGSSQTQQGEISTRTNSSLKRNHTIKRVGWVLFALILLGTIGGLTPLLIKVVKRMISEVNGTTT